MSRLRQAATSGSSGMPSSLPVAYVRTHMYYVRAHTHSNLEDTMSQTELAFIDRHFMLTKVRGRFTGVSGVIQVTENPGETSVQVFIDMASVESGSQARDDHLRSADFFDA